MPRLRFYSLIFLLFLFPGFAGAENPEKSIDSLLALTKKTRSMYPDQALVYAGKAYYLALSSQLPEKQIRAMTEIGWIQVMKTHLDSSIKITLKAKELAEKLDLRNEVGRALLVLGMNHNYLGDYEVANNEFFAALKIFEELNDREGTIRALNSIGSDCYQQGDYNKAFIYYNDALSKARLLKDPEVIANVLNNVGLVFAARKQYDKAIECYKESMDFNSRIGQLFRLAGNWVNLGLIYKDQNKYDLFLEYCGKAEDIYIQLGNVNNLAACRTSVGEYYFTRNDYENAVSNAMMAYRAGIRFNLKDIISNSANLLHEIYKQEKITDSAYKYALIHYQYKDSLEGERSSTRLTQLELQYQYDKDRKEQKMKQQQKDFYVVILIILVIAGLIIAFLLLSRQIIKTKNIRLEKKQLSDELDYKNKELTINVMNLLKRNEFLVDHTNRLIEIQQKATEDPIKTDILHLINSLQRGSGEDIWDEFELRFKQVHSGFYERLLSSYPELTPNELKLCALLRLNLSTKEICELTGQRPASLDVARSRLRKKLALPSSQTNLVTFLSQI